MDVDHQVEAIVGHRVERRVGHGSRVVHHDVDASPVIECGVDDRPRAVTRRDAVGVRDRLPTVVANLPYGGVGRVGGRSLAGDRGAEIVDEHAGTAFGE
ncbi:hypothetical protein AU195_15810 [Mycobacterium sp. IS-1496]|nr:hypothetical protein AU195_15810 [Mycobacterium sp. IS-1496]